MVVIGWLIGLAAALWVALYLSGWALLVDEDKGSSVLACRYFTGIGTVVADYDIAWRQACPRWRDLSV